MLSKQQIRCSENRSLWKKRLEINLWIVLMSTAGNKRWWDSGEVTDGHYPPPYMANTHKPKWTASKELLWKLYSGLHMSVHPWAHVPYRLSPLAQTWVCTHMSRNECDHHGMSESRRGALACTSALTINQQLFDIGTKLTTESLRRFCRCKQSRWCLE